MKKLVTTPVEESDIKLSAPKNYSAGIEAIMVGTKMMSEAGLARCAKGLLVMNQYKGFDCPGCAWPEPIKRSTFEFCENGIKAIAEEATEKTIGAEFFKSNSIETLSKKSDHFLGKSGRLAEPMILREKSDYYEPISYEEAFDIIAKKLKAIKSNQAVFYTSGRTSNEAAYLYQLLARLYGTNNLPDCSNMCHESSGKALTPAIGIGKGTVKLEDFYSADLILVVGQNPGTNHPRMLATLQEARRSGVKIISINPLKEAGLMGFKHPQKPLDILGMRDPKVAEEFYQVRPGGDFAFFCGINKLILEKHPRGIDESFVKNHTENFKIFKKNLDKISWDYIEKHSGISKNEIEHLTNRIIKSKKVISCWAMGLTQRKDSVHAIRSIVDMHLLGGFIGKKGSGLCPVRGHSNVQGDRTVGINERPPKVLLDSLKKKYRFNPPEKHGYSVVQSIKALHEGKVKFFMALGGNIVSASSDTVYTAEAMRKADLSVHVSTKLNRSHLLTGKVSIILPTLSRSDRDLSAKNNFVSVENSMGFVSSSRGNLKPRGNFLSEIAIVCNIAKRTLDKKIDVDWDKFMGNYNLIRNEIESVISGFANYNKRVKDGFYLPNPPRDNRTFKTPNQKAIFSDVVKLNNGEVSKDEYVMFTIRTHDQYNTTIYGLDDRYRGIKNGRRIILMNKGDMNKEGFNNLEEIKVTSYYKGKKYRSFNFKAVGFNIPSGAVATYFPEANILIPIDSVADISNTPSSKYVVTRLAKV